MDEQALRGAVWGDDEDVAYEAIHRAQTLPRDAATRLLREALQDRSLGDMVRWGAVQELAELDDLEPVSKAFEDGAQGFQVRSEALHWLAASRDSRRDGQIRSGLNDADKDVRRLAFGSIAAARRHDFESVISEIVRTDTSFWIRRRARQVLHVLRADPKPSFATRLVLGVVDSEPRTPPLARADRPINRRSIQLLVAVLAALWVASIAGLHRTLASVAGLCVAALVLVLVSRGRRG